MRVEAAACVALFALAVALLTAQQSSPVPGEAGGQRGRAGGAGRVGGPARDQPDQLGAPAGTARIRGVILSADTGSPIKRAIVRVGGSGLRGGRMATTDDQGRYEIRELPAGRFTLSVTKAGFVTLQYGQRRAFDQGRPLDVADGQLLNGVNVSLPRGGVITGRLVDEAGEPVTEAIVSASRYQFTRGQRRLVPVGRSDQSNDLGQYRLYGLMPGEYVVTATLRSGPMFEQRDEAVDGYAPTYFPGTASPGDAQRIRVEIGQEAVADFALVPARLVRVSGTVLTSNGTPLTGGFARLVDASRLGGSGPMAGAITSRIQGDGLFSFNNVAPGTYMLIASSGAPGRRGGGGAGLESGRVPITVGNTDLTNVLVTTGFGTVVSGRIVLEGGGATVTPSSLRVFASEVDTGDGMAVGNGDRNGRINDDWTFEIPNLFGRAMLFVNNTNTGATGRLTMKAVTLNGQDVTYSGFDTQGQARIDGVEIVLTTRVSELSGTVYDGRQRPLQDYVAVVFSADESRWQDPSGRSARVGRPDQDGKFAIVGLPPGDYLAVAVDYLESGTEADPDILARLRPFAGSVRIAEGEKKSLTLDLSDVQ
jgi:hypothetical protein